NGVDYPHRSERATISGKINVWDPRSPHPALSNLLVGLSAPDYTPATISRGRGGFGGFGLGGGGEDDTNTVSSAGSNSTSRAELGNGLLAGATNAAAGGTNRFGRNRGAAGG